MSGFFFYPYIRVCYNYLVKKYSLLSLSLGLVVIFSLLHFSALFLHLYWTVWWFDNAMHFLGGFIGGLIVIWFLFDSGIFYKRVPSLLIPFLLVLLLALIVGVAWEIFEYVNGIAKSTEEYIPDTFRDIVFDVLGGAFASLVGFKQIFRIKN